MRLARNPNSNLGSKAGLPDEELTRTLKIYQELDGNASEAARRLGVADRTIARRVKAAKERGLHVDVKYPEFPAEDVDAETILDHHEKRENQRAEFQSALNWFRVGVNDKKPIGINWFGDPHLGSNGCRVKQLRNDIDLVIDTEGMYAANVGDTIDGWSDRMVRLYAENDVSRDTEWRLARWFLREKGIPWLVWLFGNHDNMHSGFTSYLKANNAFAIPMLDWRAKFIVEVGGKEFRIDAAHDHKGHSWFHELHGQIRAAMESGYEADFYISGHKHNWAVMTREGPDGRARIYARARGYKFGDSYELHGGFQEYQGGCSIVTVLDPTTDDPLRRIRAFPSTAEGCEYLTWARRR